MALTFGHNQQPESPPIERADLDAASKDPGVVAFGLLAIAALLVSMPATYVVMARYHSHDEIGTMQSVASLIVFECGAVISKLATLLFPAWRGRLTALQVALLAFVAGANALATTAAAPTGEEIQAIAFAGLLPFFQLVFLSLCVARIKSLHLARLQAAETRQPTQAERLATTLAEAQERAFASLLAQVEQQMTVTILPQPQLAAPIAIHARPASTPTIEASSANDAGDHTPAPAPLASHPTATNAQALDQNADVAHQDAINASAYACENCGSSLPSRGAWLASKRWGKCAACR